MNQVQGGGGSFSLSSHMFVFACKPVNIRIFVQFKIIIEFECVSLGPFHIHTSLCMCSAYTSNTTLY